MYTFFQYMYKGGGNKWEKQAAIKQCPQYDSMQE